jgi:cyclopropane-fatty-acyl-phospholipid synthase
MKIRGQNSDTYKRQGLDLFARKNRTSHGPTPATRDRSPESRQPVNQLDILVAKKILQLIGYSSIQLTLWDGSEVSAGVDQSKATIHFRDRASLYRSFWNPELHWGDLYSEGRVEVHGDLPGLLAAVYQSQDRDNRPVWLRRLTKRIRNPQARVTRRRATDNIHHHYDIGNDFYRLWLDRDAMQYTCAYYPNPDMTLEQAQVAKMQHVCRKLQLKPGDRVVEAGCGWGGLGLYMAKNYGVTVKAYNISVEQVNYAKEMARAQDLDRRVEYILDDYRNISGEFDVFVSVGMLEHVGPGHYPVLGQLIDRVLKPQGRGLIHSIGRNRSKPLNAWIEKRIFPGAYAPSLGEIMGIFETNHFSVLDVENLRLHYAHTLDDWLRRYEQQADQVAKLMDEQFVRGWRLYLAGSKAAFTSGQLQLFQIVFNRERDNSITRSRAHQYSDETNACTFD